MKTREQIYRKEAAELLRDVSTYRHIRRKQLLRLYPGKEEKIENLLSYLERQGRIFYDEQRELYHDGTDAVPNTGTLAALWVLADFVDRVEYHSAAEFPACLVFLSGGEIYEVVYVAADSNSLTENALSLREPDGRRIVIAENEDLIPELNISGVAAYCTVTADGEIRYYKQAKEEPIGTENHIPQDRTDP